MVILDMNLEVFGKVIDALTEERNLHFGRACVRLMNPELLDDFVFLLFSDSHVLRSFSLFPFLVANFLPQGYGVVKLPLIGTRAARGCSPGADVKSAASFLSGTSRPW